MAVAVLFVTPELLPHLALALPARIVGSVDSGVRAGVGLLVESQAIPEGCAEVTCIFTRTQDELRVRIDPIEKA